MQSTSAQAALATAFGHRRSSTRRDFLAGSAKVAGGGVLALALSGGSAAAGSRTAVAMTLDGIPAARGSDTTVAQVAVGGVDPQNQEVLNALDALGPLPTETLTPRQAREQPSFADAVQGVRARRGLPPAVEPVGSVEHRIIPGGAGSDGTLVRIYTPAGPGPFPVVLDFHGGGWVIANLNVYDGSARAITNAANAVVVSVAYRQAPENKFPAAVDDSFAAYQWVLGNAGSINGDPARVAVAGESAGGDLAAVTARLARDRGVTLPAHQLLIYPITDLAGEYPSYQEQFNATPLSTPLLRWFGGFYLRNDADRQDPNASPLLVSDLRGLPSATVILAEIDPLRDQGAAYAARLRDAGVTVSERLYRGVPHEFFGGAAVIDQGKDAVALAGNNLSAAFGRAATFK